MKRSLLIEKYKDRLPYRLISQRWLEFIQKLSLRTQIYSLSFLPPEVLYIIYRKLSDGDIHKCLDTRFFDLSVTHEHIQEATWLHKSIVALVKEEDLRGIIYKLDTITNDTTRLFLMFEAINKAIRYNKLEPFKLFMSTVFDLCDKVKKETGLKASIHDKYGFVKMIRLVLEYGRPMMLPYFREKRIESCYYPRVTRCVGHKGHIKVIKDVLKHNNDPVTIVKIMLFVVQIGGIELFKDLLASHDRYYYGYVTRAIRKGQLKMLKHLITYPNYALSDI